MKRFVLAAVIIATTLSSYAQSTLKFKINGMEDSTVFLARYLGDRLYYADTTEAKNGVAIFKKDEYPGGTYAVICPGPKYFEVIVAEKNIEIETHIDDFIGNMKVKKSEENKVYFGFIDFISKKRPDSQKLIAERNKLDKVKDKDKIEEINKKINAIDEEVMAYQKNLVKNNPDKFVSKLINMSIDPVIPDEIAKNDTLKYQYYRTHYWDNIDVSDKRLVHSQVFHNKLDFYFQRVLMQHPDTICEHSHALISKIEEGSEMFKYVVHYITYNYETSKIMGMDAVFVCMAQTYYCPPDNSKAFWLKESKLEELCDRASALEPLLVGKPAPRIVLADTSEKKWFDFYTQVKNEYTALIFWADDCGHCKKEMPHLIKLYHELKEKGVDIEFVAVGTSLENDKWKEFIKENKLDWINISDFPEANDNPKKYIYEMRVTDLKSLNFRKTYDIFSTPQIYLLDKDKTIIAKRLDAKNMAGMLERIAEVELEFNDNSELEEKEKMDKVH